MTGSNGDLPAWALAIRYLLGLVVAIIIELLWLAGIVYAKLGWVDPLSVLEWGVGLAVTMYMVRGLHEFGDVISGGGAGDSKRI